MVIWPFSDYYNQNPLCAETPMRQRVNKMWQEKAERPFNQDHATGYNKTTQGSVQPFGNQKMAQKPSEDSFGQGSLRFPDTD